MKYSKLIVLLVILLNVVFAASVFAILFCGYEEPEALIAAWYAFTGVELLSLAGIKISDNNKCDDSDEQPESEDNEKDAN